MILHGQHSSLRAARNREHGWLVSILCALALFGVLFVMVEIGVPLPVVVLGLVAACLAACGWAVFVAVRTRRKVDDALRSVMRKGEVVR